MTEQPWVAIIDDDESVRASLSRILDCADIQATSFGSGEAFLRRAVGPEPTCVVLDVHLGAGLNGFELKELLEAEGRSLPIIFMTGHAEVSLPARWALDGTECLRKPFATEELISLVRRHLLAAPTATGALPDGP